MLDKTNWKEPTEKFITNFGVEGAKDWFNADLIFFALEIAKEKDQKDVVCPIIDQYKDYCKAYDLDLSEEELMEQFGNYNQEEFDDFMKSITNNLFQ